MNVETLLQFISEYGYAALFFALWLGIVGLPIPDEVIVMTGGAASSTGLFHPGLAFLVTYLGVISGLSLGFFVGRFLGATAIDRLKRKKNFEKYLKIAENLIRKYGNFALSLSYFLPVVRHIVPYLVGIGSMTFRRYALYSYTAGFVWTAVFFVLGRFAGASIQTAGALIYRYGVLAGVAVAAAVVVFVVLRNRKKGAL
ncbi:DedA family protein [Paenibacillus hodogayensis]|uniref:DedA family protein n=1 Tax=Paenibacillus hodogayensis TaxID=279208 RepID=A0ABV5W479_9BACL